MVLLITIIAAVIFYLLTNFQNLNSSFFAVALIIIFILFLFFQYKMELQDQTPENFNPKYSQLFSYILLVIGLFFLYFGSKYFILGSKELATYFNISETIIGLTLVAFGTSLPELSTGIVAAFRKQSNLAVGTILGSNVYNIVGIFALILFLKSGKFPNESNILMINIFIMTLVTLFFVYKIRFGFKLLNIQAFRLGKGSGVLFIILYVVYNLYNYTNLN